MRVNKTTTAILANFKVTNLRKMYTINNEIQANGREEFAPKYWARSSPLGESLPSLPVNALVQDFAIYETKREKLKYKIPYAITVQDLQ